MTRAPQDSAPQDSWTVAIHRSHDDREPVGAGVVIDHSQVLTCQHVLAPDGVALDEIWVAFPKDSTVDWGDRRRVRTPVQLAGSGKNIDLVLLELAEPVPPSVVPARLRCTPPQDMAGQSWWAFGFPDGSEFGGAAFGTVGDSLGYGHVYLKGDTVHGLSPGFSGGALWSPEYRAVVGLVVHSYVDGPQVGNGNALTLHHIDQRLPEWKIAGLAEWQARDADDTALAAWGWVLATDDEARRHWLPRARGVATHTERGSRFRGRRAALTRLVRWLDAAVPSDRPLVLTGSPGVGKSAVLGRLVTTADREINTALPPDDVAVRATVGSISCAVHAKGKNALEIAAEVARAAAVSLPAAPADVVPALRERLTRRPSRFNLVVDALDEAASPAEARTLIRDVVLPLIRDCARLGAQVIVGTRRSDDLGDLLAGFGADADVVDLDEPAYFAESDLADYALATLRTVGAERPDNPYRDDRVAVPVAQRIAELSRGNFLVAGLVARGRGLRDTHPVPPESVSFSAKVADVLDDYVADLPAAGHTSARLALTALAYAETPGLPLELWQAAVQALGGAVTSAELAVFARTSAANFLVETGATAAPTYRLFHQALNEALLAARAEYPSRAADESRLVAAWLHHATGCGWAAAPDYLLRSLPGHALRTGRIDVLLADDDYLLHVHLDRLLPAAEMARTDLGRARAQLLQRTPMALQASAAERSALFSVVEKLDGLPGGLAADPSAPYTARWAKTPSRRERGVLAGHSRAVHDVAAIPLDGRSLLASAGEDGTVLLWDPLTSQTESVIEVPGNPCIAGLSAVRAGRATLLATAGHDAEVRLWDPRSGVLLHTLTGHRDWVRNLCAVPMPDGTELLASAGDDRTVRLWDPADGRPVHTLIGHTGWVTAVCSLPYGPGALVASTGFDSTIRLWDPRTGRAVAVLTGHTGWVTTLTAVRGPRGPLLASAGYDGSVRLWDPLTGDCVRVYRTGAGPLTDLCGLTVDGLTLLASTAEDGVIRLWDVTTGIELPGLEGHASWIRAICELEVGNRNLLATAGNDGVVRLWDATAEQLEAALGEEHLGAVRAVADAGHGGRPAVAVAAEALAATLLLDPADGTERLRLDSTLPSVTDICALTYEDRRILAVAEGDRVVTWDLDNDQVITADQRHFDTVNAICAVRAGGRTLMASAADDLNVRFWDPVSGVDLFAPRSHPTFVTALVALVVDDRALLVSADRDGSIMAGPVDGELRWRMPGAGYGINTLCVVESAGRQLLVSGDDRTVRLWNPVDGTPVRVLSGHGGAVTEVCAVPWQNRQIIASSSVDRTVRLWDPATGRLLRTIPVHHLALSCRYLDETLVVGLDRGLLALGLR